jgi:predicted nuclease with TOPRIM domain
MTELEQEIARLKEELNKLKGECDNANKNAALAEEKVSRYDKDLDELKFDTAVKHLAGFDIVVEQVLALYPGLDLSELDIFKIVKDGKLLMVSSPT